MNRNVCLTLLICVNLVLLTALVMASTSLPAAKAQSVGLADSYMVVAGHIQDDFDALYVVEMRDRILHTFFFNKGTTDIQYGGDRLLDQDFRHNRSQP